VSSEMSSDYFICGASMSLKSASDGTPDFGDREASMSSARASDTSSNIGGGKAKEGIYLNNTPPSSLCTASQHLELISPSDKEGISIGPTRYMVDQQQWEPSSHIAVAGALTSTTPIVRSLASSDDSCWTATPTSMDLRPVMYSAIGSLEDPNSSSYSGWKKRPKKTLNSKSSRKHEIDSRILLPPATSKSGGRANIDTSSSILSKNSCSIVDNNSAATLSFAQTANDLWKAPSSHNSAGGNKSPEKVVKITGKPNITLPPDALEKHRKVMCALFGDEPIAKISPSKKEGDNSDVKINSAVPAASVSAGGASTEIQDEPLKGIMLPNENRLKTCEENTRKKVTISENPSRRKGRKKKKNGSMTGGPVEMFRPSSDAYTPRMGKKEIKYKPAEMRTPVQKMASPLGTLSRPNFKDALRRVAMIIHQHIVKIERRFENKSVLGDDGLFKDSMASKFLDKAFAMPTYRCTMVRVPMARSGMIFGLKKNKEHYEIPTEQQIYEFAHQLFKAVRLSSECSIVCLIYVERLMEVAKVPLLASTWRTIFMCGLLLASKVWQDLSSWNIEFSSVYPQYSLDSINRLELQFLRLVKWDLYISSTLYAKYYFALRSLVEKPDFRQRYNRMVGGVDRVQASEALNVEKRSSLVKEEALLQISRSM